MARLIWKSEAVDTLNGMVRNRLRDVGPVAARAMRQQIIGRIGQLRDFPELGRRASEEVDETLRELVVPPYRIAYVLVEDTVTILDIYDTRRARWEEDDGD